MSDQNATVAVEPELPSRQAIVLVVDLVESVLLMQADEAGVIRCWQAFMTFVDQVVLPRFGGRLVKNLGDGLMVEFTTAREAVFAAALMHNWMAGSSLPLRTGQRLSLRAGLHATRIFEGANDIYGIGVNLAARIATLAEAGETIATAELRDLLNDFLDADVEDLGECHLKHLNHPVRAFRLGPARRPSSLPAESSFVEPLHASLAVIPFSNLLSPKVYWGIGDLLAEGIIGALSMSSTLRVVSRLSSASFRDRSFPLSEIASRLGVRYVVSGSYTVKDHAVTVSTELADAATGNVLWSGRVRENWRDLLDPHGEIAQQIADSVHQKLMESTVARASSHPLPALASYEIFLGGITMMHRASADDFARSRQLLDSLVERHRRIAMPHAWLAKWHVLRAIQGSTTDLASSATEALSHTKRALDLEPGSALALAIEGFVYCHLKKDLETAEQRLLDAQVANPNEGFGWLFSAVMHAFEGKAAISLDAGHRALSLSPMDPLRYYYESLLGSCEYGAGNFDEAIRLCESSRRRNRQHLSTLRILIAAYAATGQMEHAIAVGNEVRRLRPGFTVAGYEATSVAALFPFGKEIARALREVGIP